MNFPPLVYEQATKVLAQDLQASGLRIENHFRVCDQGMALTHEAIAVMRKTGFPLPIEGNDSIAGFGLARDGGFWHPLSEQFSEKESGVEGGAMNNWAAASLLINASLGWIESSDRTRPLGMVKESVGKAAPTVAVDELMESARYSDAALMKLVTLTKEGLDTAIAHAFDKRK